MAEFRMPSLGADMDEGTLIAWHVAVVDRVTKGEIVAEVDTDKSVIDVETFATGTVDEILVPKGGRVPVGTRWRSSARTTAPRRPTPSCRRLADSTAARPRFAATRTDGHPLTAAPAPTAPPPPSAPTAPKKGAPAGCAAARHRNLDGTVEP